MGEPLSPKDQQRLRSILKCGYQLEKYFGACETIASLPADMGIKVQDAIRSFQMQVQGCADAEAAEFRRLGELSERFPAEMKARDLVSFLVPFERLSKNQVKDSDFLVNFQDLKVRDVIRVPLVGVLENIRSSFNVGSIFRTSESLGLEQLYLTGYTPTPENEKTHVSALGTADHVPWSTFRSTDAVLSKLRRDGYEIIALETAEPSESLFQFSFSSGPTALLVGNERFGLDAQTLQSADRVCRIPHYGLKNSLNVAVAFAVVAFEWRKQVNAETVE